MLRHTVRCQKREYPDQYACGCAGKGELHKFAGHDACSDRPMTDGRERLTELLKASKRCMTARARVS
jgi:hypothetical protein